jgi:hypothetical protein
MHQQDKEKIALQGRDFDQLRLAAQLYDLMRDTSRVTHDDLANGKTIDTLIRNTVEELGEFCNAVAVEDGYKDKRLVESSLFEAGDTVICALSLFFGRGGTIPQLIEVIAQKLPKWDNRVTNQTIARIEIWARWHRRYHKD